MKIRLDFRREAEQPRVSLSWHFHQPHLLSGGAARPKWSRGQVVATLLLLERARDSNTHINIEQLLWFG